MAKKTDTKKDKGDNHDETIQENPTGQNHSSSILSPNVQFGVTAIVTAIQVLLICWMLCFPSGNQPLVTKCKCSCEDVKRCPSFTPENTDTAATETSCHKTLQKRFANLKETVTPWIGVLKDVFDEAGNSDKPLRTLRSLHDDMMNTSGFTITDTQSPLDRLVDKFKKMSSSKDKEEEKHQEGKLSTRVRSELLELRRRLSTLVYNMKNFRNSMNKSLNIHVTKWSNTFHELLSGMKTDIATVKGELTAQSERTTSLTADFQQNKEDINEIEKALKDQGDQLRIVRTEDLVSVSDKVKTVENNLKVHTGVLDDYIKTNNKNLQDQQNQIGKIGDESLPNLESRFREMSENMRIATDNIAVFETFRILTSQDVEAHRLKIKRMEDEKIPALERDSEKAISVAAKAESEAKKNEEESLKRQAEYEKFRDETKSMSSYEQSVSREQIDEIRRRFIFYDVSFYMGLFSIGCCVFMITNLLNRTGGLTKVTRTYGETKTRPREDKDTYHLRWSGPKENSVCVVTFHSETERQHTSETRSVFESVGAHPPTIHSRVVRRHSDIENLPGSRIFLVYIDFNERNVILEDPSKGLGDLRVTTVRSLWKFGGDVAVIYCKDQGSRNLDGELFNRDLSSVYSQPELSQLRNHNRMLSIFEGFSEAQKQHCRDFINSQLKRA